ncbi:unnamed protein product, partial [Effrenium voratum]
EPEAVAAIAREAKLRTESLESKELVNLAWAFSKVQLRDAELMAGMARRLATARILSRQDAGNAAWAFAKADVACWPLMQLLRSKFLAEANHFEAQELASTVWAFAWLEAADQVLLRAMAARARAVVPELNAAGLARVCWAFASLGEGAAFPELAAAAAPRVRAMDAPNLAKLAWAFARAELNQRLRDIAGEAQERDVASLNPRDVEMLIWALAKGDVMPPELMGKLAERSAQLAPQLDAQGLANCAAAMALAEVKDEADALRKPLAARAKELLGDFSSQHLCDLQWAFAAQSWLEPCLEEAIRCAPGWAERPPYAHEARAGGIADCFKHLVLVALLQSLAQEKGEAPFYVDTHAGAGIYDPQEMHAVNLQRLRAAEARDGRPSCVAAYLRCLDASEGYPGSPRLARQILGSAAAAVVFEAAPQSAARLRWAMEGSGWQVRQEDAYRGLPELFARQPERALVFIDPPYELCFADNLNFRLLRQLQSHWPTSCVAIWYPIRDDARSQRVYRRIGAMGLRVMACEFSLSRSACAKGAIRTGMLVVRPPETLEPQLREALPALAEILAAGPEVYRHHEIRWL